MMSTTQRARELGSGLLLLAVSLLLWIACAPAVRAQSSDRVFGAVDVNARVAMRGHHPSWASPDNDAGAVPADLSLQHLTVILARSPQTQQAFEEFLARQQDPASSDYHHWLTPVEVGERFGVSLPDIGAVGDWLKSQGLRVDSISNSRVRITFSGPAAAVGNAFGAEMHYFNVSGKQRISITAEPQIPVALAPVIQAIHGLYTIENRPMHKIIAPKSSAESVTPDLTGGSGRHYVAPADFDVIYDLNSVYGRGVNGTGQTIAIIGEARVYNPDIENFQSLSGLSTKDPTVIIPPNGVDPGPPVSSGGTPDAQGEATLDVTRAGSVAPGATILLVVSAPSGGGIATATEYVVDTTPVPAHVISISFGGCEAVAGQGGVAFWDTLFSQGAAEGISSFVSSGDSGAAGCDDHNQPPPANQFLSPNYICSSSYVTCVGGTEFADTANPSQYWTTSNGSGLKSVLTYIPEGGWNDPLNGSTTQLAASGGGVSAFIPTPSWQTGAGVPAARAGRYTPDVSFSAALHDPYFLCLAADGVSCVVQQNGGFSFEGAGGTSASTPDMAGVAALLNQQQGGPQGNLNPGLYQLAAMSSNAFHDVTVASSGVANCAASTPSMCNNSTPSPSSLTGGLAGYLVGTGYDEVTGLGSLDVTIFLASWSTVTSPSSTTTSLGTSSNPSISGLAVMFTATVTTAGSTTPTGTVVFQDGATQLGSGTLNGAAVATFTTTSLTLGAHSITAVYGGDAHNLGSTSAVLTETIQSGWTLTVASTNPSTGVAITVSPTDKNGQSNGTTQFTRTYNNGVLVSLGAAASAGGNSFSTWTGCDSVSGTTCTVTMGANRSVSANYVGADSALRFIPLTPCRIVDTRNSNGPFGGPAISAGGSGRSFVLPNSPCLSGVPATVAAYSLNVTTVPAASSLGYLTIWPTGQPQPLVSTLNSYDGRVKANAAIVPAGTGGAVSVYVTDVTHLVLDINGYFLPANDPSAPLAFFPLPPCRLVDTRNPGGSLGGPSLAAGQARSFPLQSGGCNIPSTAQAYSLNFTAVPPGPLGYLTTWPSGTTQPLVSTLNAPTGTVTANAAIVPAGDSGAISVYVKDASDVVIDINGYFAPSTTGTDLSLYTLPPCRVVDTRETTGLFSGQIREDMTASPCGIPASAQAVVLNATVVPSQGFGYLTLWPDGQTQPLVSTLNAYDGLVTSNMAIVPTSSGKIDVYATDPTQLILDTSGYFASGTTPP